MTIPPPHVKIRTSTGGVKMSKADWIYLRTTNRILKDGSWDTKEIVRPKWEDGTPAHTVKVFGVNNVYNLVEEFPIVTMRLTNWRAAIDEVLWIWQKKSNNVNDLNSHIWDQWADKNGSIGKAYGYQVGRKAKYKHGELDQIDNVLWYLKNQPAFRSMVTELFVHEDLHEMGLYPCVHGMQLDVTDGKLNMFLNQRSNDVLAAGSWNVVQYAALLHMLAKASDLEPGVLSHMVVNSHIYDRHVPFIVDITMSRAQMIEERVKDLNMIEFMETKPLNEEKTKKFLEFMVKIKAEPMNYENIIEEARKFEKTPTDFESYTKKVVETIEFKRSDYIIETMLNNPEFEKVLGFSTPKLELDPNVKNFYDFKSPKMKDAEGNIVDNPESSFKVTNYRPKKEGIKLQERVPVAE